jgi:hypothetical protein
MRRRTRYLRIRCHLRQEPEVIAMSAALGLDPDAVCGKLIRFWDWATSVSHNGHIFVTGSCALVRESLVDRAVECQNFAKTMQDVGWLAGNDEGFVVPEYDAWLSQAALDKAHAVERAAKSRARKTADSCCASVTDKSHRDREREREDKEGAGAPSCGVAEPKKGKKGGKGYVQPNPNREEPIDRVATVGRPDVWFLFPSKISEMQEVFPNLNAADEIRKAIAWTRQGPDNRKTARGMATFLFNWLSRATAKPGASTSTRPSLFDRPPPQPIADIIKRQEEQYGAKPSGSEGEIPF